MQLKTIFFVSFLSCWINLDVFGQAIQDAINQLATSQGMEGATLGVHVADAKTNLTIAEFQSTKLLAPASTTKLFSTAYALENLGADYKPVTHIYYTGEITDSILRGDIWIVGGGDMSLGSNHFFSDNRTGFLTDWATKVKQLGIKMMEGTIYGDGSDFGLENGPSDWLWGDMGNYYGAHFSGLMLFENTLEYYFKTGSSGSKAELIRTYPQVDSLKFSNGIMASTSNGDNSYIFGSPYSWLREGRGELPQNRAEFRVRGSLPDPEGQLAMELKKALISNGIEFKGNAINARYSVVNRPVKEWKLLLKHEGMPIRFLIKETNFESINVFAEGLMRITAYQMKGVSLHDQASKAMEAYWRQKLSTNGLFLNDGSGLSRTNAISAKALCDLLLFMNQSVHHADFYASLPVTGVSGTLKSVAKNQAASGRIHAKSGTMRRTKSYAGYVETISGRRLAFSMIVNNYTCTNREIVKYMEALMNELVKL